jgi:hypothetical protein
MSPRVLSRHEAARVWQAAACESAWAGLVVGLALATGWTATAVAQALGFLQEEDRS